MAINLSVPGNGKVARKPAAPAKPAKPASPAKPGKVVRTTREDSPSPTDDSENYWNQRAIKAGAKIKQEGWKAKEPHSWIAECDGVFLLPGAAWGAKSQNWSPIQVLFCRTGFPCVLLTLRDLSLIALSGADLAGIVSDPGNWQPEYDGAEACRRTGQSNPVVPYMDALGL